MSTRNPVINDAAILPASDVGSFFIVNLTLITKCCQQGIGLLYRLEKALNDANIKTTSSSHPYDPGNILVKKYSLKKGNCHIIVNELNMVFDPLDIKKQGFVDNLIKKIKENK